MAVRHVLKDEVYIQKSEKWISEERPRFLKSLNNISFIDKVFFTYGNYVLCKLNGITSDKFYKLCIVQGFVIRKADNFRGLDKQYIRLAIKDNGRNEKLIQCLKNFRI